MSEWRECLLKEIADIQTGPFGSQLKNEQYITGGTPVVTVEHIQNFRISSFNYPSVTEEDKLRLSRYLLKTGDIVFTRVGSVDLTAWVKPSQNGWMFSSRMLRVRPVSEVDSRFLSYYFQQKSFREHILNISVGATMPSINTGILEGVQVAFPPLPEQRAIAAVLSSLDEKIDILHRQNKTLEAMAETLFRQWFIEEADDNWEVCTVADLCHTITKGTTPTTLGHNFTEIGVNFVKAESITDTGDFIWDKFAKISYETHEFLNRSILQDGDVLCSIAGTIGRLSITTRDILPANTNQAIAIIRTNPLKCFPEFIYLFLKSPLFREIMDGKIVHAVQPNLSLGEIGNTPIKIPSKKIMDEFHKIIKPLFIKKIINAKQIRTLEKLRDTLLQKLMIGEVSIEV